MTEVEPTGTPVRIGGYYFNNSDPLWARFLALRKAQELIDNPRYQRLGDFTVRVLFADEHQQAKKIIYDSACNNSLDLCVNLEYEYNLIRQLGCTIKDWEIVSEPDGRAFQAKRSEFRVSEYIMNLSKPDIEMEEQHLGFKLN